MLHYHARIPAAQRLPGCQPRIPCFQAGHINLRSGVVAAAVKAPEGETDRTSVKEQLGQISGLGDALGPIGMTIGGDVKPSRTAKKEEPKAGIVSSTGIELGPIGMTVGPGEKTWNVNDPAGSDPEQRPQSIHSMTTEEWRAKYEKDGTVDLWVEEEFNAGSRLVGGRDVHNGGVYGFRTGEGPSAGDVAVHKVKIFNHYDGAEIDVEVPEDRYILWEAEDKGLQLPYACRMGCCTVCAVRVKEGDVYQPEALGVSSELREKGYALMCVAFPNTDCVLETVPEDEVYELQFGESFAKRALDPTNPEAIERDDFALSMANMDE